MSLGSKPEQIRVTAGASVRGQHIIFEDGKAVQLDREFSTDEPLLVVVRFPAASLTLELRLWTGGHGEFEIQCGGMTIKKINWPGPTMLIPTNSVRDITPKVNA